MKNNARQIVLHLSPWLLLTLGACGGGGDTLQTISPIAAGEQLPAGMPVIGDSSLQAAPPVTEDSQTGTPGNLITVDPTPAPNGQTPGSMTAGSTTAGNTVARRTAAGSAMASSTAADIPPVARATATGMSTNPGTVATVRTDSPPPAPAPFTTSDPLRAQQWHLRNTGSTLNAVAGEDLNLGGLHRQFRGEGIRLAVVDNGVDVLHDDLLPNVVPGASHNYLPEGQGNALPLPVTPSDDHGTAVAGIVAARDDNGLGGVGVAPRAGLVAYNALAHQTDVSLLDALTRGLADNQIYSNSWGALDTGHFEHVSAGDGALASALGRGLREGRGGKGAVYVFAGGNGAQTGDYSVYDSNVSHYGMVTVCAVNAGGRRTLYSEAGPNLTVCAPSGDSRTGYGDWQAGITTLLPGQGYRDNFNGTSAAVPMVSGVVALMLQANPDLTWRDVPLVLAHSARQVDAGSPGWRSLPGSSLRYHHHYGFGGVDAQAAVKLARQWSSVGGSESVRQCGPYRKKVRGAIPERIPATTGAAPDNTDSSGSMEDTRSKGNGGIDENVPVQDGLLSAIDIPADCPIQHIEHVDVRMTAVSDNYRRQHPGPGDLHITLTSPLGQVSTLATPHDCYRLGSDGSRQGTRCVGLKDFRFGLRRHMDEPAATASNRSWTLGMADRRAGNHGKLYWWEITLYGRE